MTFKMEIKTTKQKVAALALLALLITLSFALGFLVAREYNQAPIIIEKYSD